MATHIKKIGGISELYLYIGTTGPRIKNNSGVIEMRNNADNAYAVARAADPANEQDLTTLNWAWKFQKFIPISAQADCSSALPTNTAARRLLVVTTAGNGAVIGDLLYDNASSTGSMTIIAAAYRTITPTANFTGGTQTFYQHCGYLWNGSSWVKVFDASGAGSATNNVRSITITTGTSATYDSTNDLPANAIIVYAYFKVTTAYSAGAGITFGVVGNTDIYLTGVVNPEAEGFSFSDEPFVSVGASDVKARISVSGTPAAGAGVCYIHYVVPYN